MITDNIEIRPRYAEVDQMGYVYHANYVTYCHQARTELFRKYNIHDSELEKNGVMIPVISFNITYKKPAHYDEVLKIITSVETIKFTRLKFYFEIYNCNSNLICSANSEIAFVHLSTRKPMRIPQFVNDVLNEYQEQNV
jgi:acyl-CoA thioester hydrolase